MKRSAAAGLLVMIVAASAYGADPLTAPGKIDAVTVYRGEALVTRVVDVPGAVGLKEIVVTDLPARVESQSLYAEGAEGVEVRSVLYRERPVSEDVRADVRKLDDDIQKVSDQLMANRQNLVVVGQKRDYLTKLEAFAAPTANAELTKGVLNAETLKALTDYIFQKRKDQSDEELKLSLEQRTLNEQLVVLQRSREQIAQRSSKTVREAVIFVNQKAAGAKIKVRYLVDAASWDPSYNIRADRTGKVTAEYNASIQQQSGEDWPEVQMTLSTATPSLVAEAPMLSPLNIALRAPAPGSAEAEQTYAELRAQYQEKLREAELARNGNNFDGSLNAQAAGGAGGFGGGGGGGGRGGRGGGSGGQQGQAGGNTGPNAAYNNTLDNLRAANEGLNDVAGQQQVAELLAKKSAEERTGRARATREVISVTYELPSRTSLPSRSDQQLIQVASLPMKGTFYKLAQPLLTSYVYDTAEMSNDSKMVLLAGPVSSYMDGQFVGHTNIPTVAIGETFTIGFGIDSSLRASRERIDKTEATQGGNRQLNYTYRLELENFGDKPVKVRLMDRLPVAETTSSTTNDVRVTMDTGESDLSKDADYQRTMRKKGMLRWDVEVPAQAIGEKAFAKEYKFKVEYDRMMTIMGVPTAK